MKSILLTGGAGYIGSHVANFLIDEGYQVSIIDNLITGNEKLIPKNGLFYNLDIDNKKEISKIIKNSRFDMVMHFAGLIRVDESVKEPEKYYQYNYEKAKVFLNTCFDNNLKNIVFSSSASVYGNQNNYYSSDNDTLNPLNPYAESKLKLENFLIEQALKKKIKYIILRYFNVAGADEKLRSGLISKFPSHLIKIACEVAVGKRDKIIVNGDDYNTEDGTPVRDFIHVMDLAEIHLLVAKYLVHKKKSNIFNCGYGRGFSVKQVIEVFNELLIKKIKYQIGPRRNGDNDSIVANTKKLNRTLYWKPKYNDLKYILKTAYEWEKKLL